MPRIETGRHKIWLKSEETRPVVVEENHVLSETAVEVKV